nr:hypothetical protein [Tanacetum cinerariifolium]
MVGTATHPEVTVLHDVRRTWNKYVVLSENAR